MIRTLLIFFSIAFALSSFSQTIKVEKDLVYGSAKDWKGNPEELHLDLYTLKSSEQHPLIVLVHGGGFYDGNKEDLTSFSNKLAEKNYVVANLNYRQGFDRTPESFDEGITLAVYRAQQDIAAAIRFLVQNSAKYNIDTSMIILLGESSGGITSLASAFVSQEEWDKALPQLREQLGTVATSGNQIQQQYSIKAIVSLWGGIPDTSLISATEIRSIPILMMHSTDDEQIAFELSSHPYVEYTTFHGSYDILQRYKNNDGCYDMHLIINAPHRMGFSQKYVLKAMEEFLENVRNKTCFKSEKENIIENPFISFYDEEEN